MNYASCQMGLSGQLGLGDIDHMNMPRSGNWQEFTSLSVVDSAECSLADFIIIHILLFIHLHKGVRI